MENSTVRRGLVVLVLVTCSMLLLWWFFPRAERSEGWHVYSISSGDTITVERDYVRHEVHLLGIDGPQPGECGFDAAQDSLGDALAGNDLVLIPDGGAKAEWPAGEAIEVYVEYSGGDIGLNEIEAGHAVADGSDHSRATAYEAATDKASSTRLSACP